MIHCCLRAFFFHASMDLYKWAYKFAPWIASDLLADYFELARATRWLDMRALRFVGLRRAASSHRNVRWSRAIRHRTTRRGCTRRTITRSLNRSVLQVD